MKGQNDLGNATESSKDKSEKSADYAFGQAWCGLVCLGVLPIVAIIVAWAHFYADGVKVKGGFLETTCAISDVNQYE